MQQKNISLFERQTKNTLDHDSNTETKQKNYKTHADICEQNHSINPIVEIY